MTARRIGVVAVLAVLVGGMLDMPGIAATPEPHASPVVDASPAAPQGLVFAPDQDIHGASIGEWSARYWQWVTSLPVGENPALDPTGGRCGYGQHDPVFFVPRTMPACTVPAGVAIFVPIAGTVCSTLEPPPYHGENEAELRACAAAEADRYTNIDVRVNGEPIPGVGRYRAQSPVFTLHVPANNILAVPEGTGRAVADGYQVVLTPLPAGDYEITIHVESVDGYALPDKTLRLTVVDAIGGE